MKESSSGESSSFSKSIQRSTERAKGSIEKSERPVSRLWRRLGRSTRAMEGKSSQACSMFSTPPLA